MPDIEIKRGYEVLPDNNIRFGIRITNISDLAIFDVEVILDFTESLFKLEGERLQKIGVIPSANANSRTAEFILKPLGCVHQVNIEGQITYCDAKSKKYRIEMRPKEVHCVCPFLKGKKMPRAEFLELSGAGHSAEMGLNFKGVTVERLTSFLVHTCKIRHYKVDDFSIDGGRMLYLASESIGEKAYYLLTALLKEEDDLTQVMLRAVSDKPHGLNGFLKETVADLRHVVETVRSAQEIGVIKKEQVINIIDSMVQRTTFGSGDGGSSVNIKDSVVQRTEFKGDEERKKRDEERQRKGLGKRMNHEGDKIKVRVEDKTAPNAENFENVISQIFVENEKKGASFVEINSGDLHRQVGGYPGHNYRMPICCRVMRDMMMVDDAILSEPPRGQGANVFIRYYLPRKQFAKTNIVQESGKKQFEKENDHSKREEISKNITNSIGTKFTLILAGDFMMGSEEYHGEKPVHGVKIKKPFYLGTYPVTQREWKEVMGNDPSYFKGDNLPVEQVSWNDIQDYIKKLNEKEGTNKYRLPTEEEWEYAARARTTTRYSFGDNELILSDYAWYCVNSGRKTHNVGQKKPNPWGLYDMHGNVWEWVQDAWHADYNGAPTDVSSWEGVSVRVVRGGSWANLARGCRSAFRGFVAPADRNDDLGFRLLRIS